jgi:hypothetical protein
VNSTPAEDDLPWRLADLWPTPIGAPGTPHIAGATRNALARAGIKSGPELAQRSQADLLQIPGFGPGLLSEAERALDAALGLRLAGDELTGWEPGGVYAGTWRLTAKAQDAAYRDRRARRAAGTGNHA